MEGTLFARAWHHPIHAVIFDCDGVLLDTLPIYQRATTQLFNVTYTSEFQITALGLGERAFAERAVDYFHLPITADEFIARRSPILDEILPAADLVPGVADVVTRFRSMQMPVAVATSTKRSFHDKKTRKHREFFAGFVAQICGDEVNETKPHPDIFQKASLKLGTFDPKTVLVFEDAVNGIQAACAAGMPSVFLGMPGVDYQPKFDELGISPTVRLEAFAKFDFDLFDWQPG
jgi:pseudouridine-5'-monophosphatase